MNESEQTMRFSFIVFAVIIIFIIADAPAFAQDEYTWKNVVVGGGGFVPGIIYHPKQRGLVYVRTDMGGAYRWDQNMGKWIPLTDMMDRTNSDYMGIFSIALDPNDTNRVYMECGKYTQHWAGVGAVLSSLNQGQSWSIVPLADKNRRQRRRTRCRRTASG